MENQQVFIIAKSLCFRERYGGVDEYISKLRDSYPVQHKKVWLPSCNECDEFWIDILVNTELLKFVRDAIIGGLLWDFVKQGWRYLGLDKFINETSEFIEKNSGNIRLVAFKFQFDDITIKVHGLHKNFTSIMSSVFNELVKILPVIQSQEVNNIIKIELPIIKDNDAPEDYRYRFDSFNETASIADYLSIWKIFADYGCMEYLYFVQERRLEEYYKEIR